MHEVSHCRMDPLFPLTPGCCRLESLAVSGPSLDGPDDLCIAYFLHFFILESLLHLGLLPPHCCCLWRSLSVVAAYNDILLGAYTKPTRGSAGVDTGDAQVQRLGCRVQGFWNIHKG